MIFAEKISCAGCNNFFTSHESLKIHLKIDHRVNEDELEKFIESVFNPLENLEQKIHIVDYQLLKKSNDSSKPKSKIFIKDVTLLRKPDLPHDINLPNIFDSLDLTTTEDDIFDDFLATDEAQIFDDDFDFDDPVVVLPDVEIINGANPPAVEMDPLILDSLNATNSSGKIFVRKNLCSESNDSNSQEDLLKAIDATNKIFVRSHESLTSQVLTTTVTQQPPSESSTPDCVIVSAETEAPQNKIFIRNIETLTNSLPQEAVPLFPATPTPAFLESTFTATPFSAGIFVRSYDSMVQENSQTPAGKISIKDMNTLIEPTLMHPPLINHNIFGQAQNLVIHMRPNDTPDENLIGYRDTSITPDTLPSSSNVSTCADNDVIILDDSEINDSSFTIYSDLIDIPPPDILETEIIQPEVLIENSLDNPERNQTPNDKPNIVENEEVVEEDQPMTRIPLSIGKFFLIFFNVF